MKLTRKLAVALTGLLVPLAVETLAVAQIPGGIGTKVYPAQPNRSAQPDARSSANISGVAGKLQSIRGSASRSALLARKLGASSTPSDAKAKATLVHYTEELGVKIKEQARALAIAKGELAQLERQTFAEDQQKALVTLNRIADEIRRDLEFSASEVRSTLARLRLGRG